MHHLLDLVRFLLVINLLSVTAVNHEAGKLFNLTSKKTVIKKKKRTHSFQFNKISPAGNEADTSNSKNSRTNQLPQVILTYT